MGRSFTTAVGARTERRAMIALLAVFALLVQALVPATANATPTAAASR